MGNGDTLGNEEELRSSNGRFRLRLQEDGNLVLYCGVDDSNPVWASRTYNKGRPPYRLVVQADNRLCLYSGDNSCVWASGTFQAGTGKAWCELLDNGNFVLYDGDAKKNPLWCTATEGGVKAPEEYQGAGALWQNIHD